MKVLSKLNILRMLNNHDLARLIILMVMEHFKDTRFKHYYNELFLSLKYFNLFEFLSH